MKVFGCFIIVYMMSFLISCSNAETNPIVDSKENFPIVTISDDNKDQEEVKITSSLTDEEQLLISDIKGTWKVLSDSHKYYVFKDMTVKYFYVNDNGFIEDSYEHDFYLKKDKITYYIVDEQLTNEGNSFLFYNDEITLYDFDGKSFNKYHDYIKRTDIVCKMENDDPDYISNNYTTIKQPTIGMLPDEILTSSWGKPTDINKTTTKYGTSEQWIYNDYKYIYFENGIVTSIQE